MRPLNRPMFRYGGPIKEGIMDGMREPKKDGNIVGGKQSPLLAGAHPLKDAEGREQHFIPALYAAGLGALNIGRAGLAAARIAGPAIKRGFQAARAFGATPGKLGFFGRAKDLATIRKGIGLPMASRPESVGFRIGSFAKQNPLLTLSAPSLGYDAARIGGPALLEGAKGIANFLVPGTALDPFKPKGKVEETGGDTPIVRLDKNKTVTGGDTGGDPNTSPKTDAEKQKINEDRINETKQKYYKLMGIDKMNKEATYDSLIDASKIIQAEGGDLKGAIKSGSLQSQLISAISKNLDKSADLKKKIDSAVLTAEIQKDINKTKMSDFDKQLAILGPEGYRKKALGETSVADMVAATKAKGTLVNSDIVSSFIESKGGKVTDTFDDTKFQKWEKNNTGKDEIDYITENFSTIDPGVYVVNGRAVEIGVGEDGKKTANYISLDKIIG